MEYNMDIKTRDTIIFGSYNPDAYRGGVMDFEGMEVSTLKKLVDMRYADPEEAQNDSPTIEEFIRWMETYDGYVVNGYVVTDKRSDYRVSIESIEKIGIIEDKDELINFVNAFRYVVLCQDLVQIKMGDFSS